MGEIDLLDFARIQRSGFQLVDKTPAFHDADPGADFLGAKYIVGSHQNRAPGIAQLPQSATQTVSRRRVETGERLIEQQHRRFFRERNSDAHLLAHALGIGSRFPSGGGAFEPGRLQRLQKLGLFRPHPGKAKEVIQVLEAGKLRIQRNLFGDIAEPGFRARRVLMRRHAVDQRRAGAWLEKAEKQIDGRGLSSAIGAQQAEDFPFPNAEVQIAQRVHRAKRLRQILRFEHDLSILRSRRTGTGDTPAPGCSRRTAAIFSRAAHP